MTTTANRQAERSQTARDNITQAALAVFALKGYAATSMDDVCLAAGCSKGGLYHHFRTKGAVLRGVVGRLARAGALLPPIPVEGGVSGVSADAVGRVLVDIWAEAARDADIRALLRTGYQAHLEQATSAEGSPLADVLRIGALVQLLTQAPDVDADEAALRLGILRAA